MGNTNRHAIVELSGADHGSTTMKKKADTLSEELDLTGLIGCTKTILSPVLSESATSDGANYQVRRIELQERRLKLEEEDLQLRKMDRIQEVEDRKLDREERRSMMENSAQMQGALLQIVNKLSEK